MAKKFEELTFKQKMLLERLWGPTGLMKFPNDVHDKKAFEKAERLGLVESDLLLRSSIVQSDGKTLKTFERAYRLIEAGMDFLGRRTDVVP